jgi:hypothetical protein
MVYNEYVFTVWCLRKNSENFTITITIKVKVVPVHTIKIYGGVEV